MDIRYCRVATILAVGSMLVLSVFSHATGQKPQNQTKGTAPMAGGLGQFETTYTLVSSDGFGPVNFTLVSANYSVARVSMKPGDNYAPSADQKLLVIHYRLKNPNSADMYYSSRSLFQAVDANNTIIEDCGESRRESNSKDMVGDTMKPGQGIDDLYTCIVLPYQAQITKLVLKLAKPGSKEMVTRYMTSGKTNVIKPLAAPYADPADKTGATALQTVTGVLGTTYPAGLYDVSLDSVALAAGPLAGVTADDGKQFFVATFTVTNKTTYAFGFDGSLNFTLKTDDGKITDFIALKAKTDARSETQSLDPGESGTARCVIQITKGESLKTLTIAEPINNSLSRAYVYDVSGVK